VNGVTTTAQNEVTDALSSYFETASSSANYAPTFLVTKVREESRYLNFTTRIAEPYNAPFSMDELLSALKRTRDTSPGPDAIHNQMLRHLPPSALSFLLSMYNRIWIEGSFPSGWGEAIVVPILKAGKDRSLPTSYRPICLTSCVCKLLERMVNSRLVWLLEGRGLLSNIQCGFRRNRSSVDHLVSLEEQIRQAFLTKQLLVAVFFDIERAYDTAWWYAILRTLDHWQIKGHLAMFLLNFMANRRFRVRLGTVLSPPRIQENGVPQGSVLSVTLFAIAINGITSRVHRPVQCSLYVDDFAIYHRSQSLPAIERQLQLNINRLSLWSRENGFKF
jgi:hypothetical protein